MNFARPHAPPRVDLFRVAELVAPKSRVLDVGCGDGLFFDRLERFGRVEGLEPDPSLVTDPRWRDRIRIGTLVGQVSGSAPADAYERLLMDALRGNAALFMRRDEVEAAWKFIDPIRNAWGQSGESPRPYAAGTWGPNASVALIRSKNPTATDAGRIALTKGSVESPLTSMLRNFERSITEDTVRNEYLLHSQIHEWFIKGSAPQDIDRLNSLVLKQVRQ